MSDAARDPRLPPGQVLTRKWPVLHAGETHIYTDLDRDWDFFVFGEVEEKRRFTWAEFRDLPRMAVHADMHCVTRWSRLDNTWEGVPTRELLNHVTPKPAATHVMVHGENGFTTNLPLADFFHENSLFAFSHDGQPLTPDHGHPIRLVVPHLYAWKSAKWVRGVEFLDRDHPGFWERLGYHMRGDPWAEERHRDGPFHGSSGL
jgi:DMSO/TMAO reductase YedYZ molybdopterin-dependent catalytic subunit